MFQVFCSQLEQLIQQLHAVSEQMELQTVPTVDIAGVKSSLAEYQVSLLHNAHFCGCLYRWAHICGEEHIFSLTRLFALQ